MRRIEPTPENPMPLPQTGGDWVRDSDGGLRPADAQTAQGAGLEFDEPESPAQAPSQD